MIRAAAAALLMVALLLAAPARAAVDVGPVPLEARPLALDGKAVLFSTGTTLWRLDRTGPARRVLRTRSGIVLASPTHVAAWRPGLIRGGRGALDRTIRRCARVETTASHSNARVETTASHSNARVETTASHSNARVETTASRSNAPIALDGRHLAYLDPCDEAGERRLVVVDLDGDVEEKAGDVPLDLEPAAVALSGGYAVVTNRARDRVALLNWKINGLVAEWSGAVRHASVAADGSVVLCRPGGVFARAPGRPLRRLSARRCAAPPAALRGGAALAVLSGPAGTQELVTLAPGASPRLRARRLAAATAPVVDRGYFLALVPTCNRRPVLLTSLVTAVRTAIDTAAGPCAARVSGLERRGRSIVAELRCPAGCDGTVSLQSDCAASPPARVRLAAGRTRTVRLPLGPRLADPVRRYRRVRLALQLRLPGGSFRTDGLSVRGDGTRKQPPRPAALAGCDGSD